mmetsp:Transcript_7459/g.17892  ORF Transcript_7459/g.17892 Transcript_7459/m.17892 type:complete len:86 (-) Transcript_7459:462-719(-)
MKNMEVEAPTLEERNLAFAWENPLLCLEIQRRFEDCVIRDDIKEAKKERKEKVKKRKRKKKSPKREGRAPHRELARDAFMGFLRA